MFLIDNVLKIKTLNTVKNKIILYENKTASGS